eukprot:984892-Prorocentrum_minimum.AAC.2
MTGELTRPCCEKHGHVASICVDETRNRPNSSPARLPSLIKDYQTLCFLRHARAPRCNAGAIFTSEHDMTDGMSKAQTMIPWKLRASTLTTRSFVFAGYLIGSAPSSTNERNCF